MTTDDKETPRLKKYSSERRAAAPVRVGLSTREGGEADVPAREDESEGGERRGALADLRGDP